MPAPDQAMASVGVMAIDNPEAEALMSSAQALHQEHDLRAAQQQHQRTVKNQTPQILPKWKFPTPYFSREGGAPNGFGGVGFWQIDTVIPD